MLDRDGFIECGEDGTRVVKAKNRLPCKTRVADAGKSQTQ